MHSLNSKLSALQRRGSHSHCATRMQAESDDTHMDPIRQITLRWRHSSVPGGSYETTQVQLWRGAPHTWQPAINAFRCENGLRICVDLAGVEQSLIDLTVEPRRMVVRGTREAPEPTDEEGRALQVLALEIDYGAFEREVHLPVEVEVAHAHAEQQNGLLWVYLPLKG
jgi:HSP20 family protein